MTEPVSAHTAGPWIVSPFCARVLERRLGRDGDFLPIAEMLWPTDERSEAETYANARLIAAAPELLEALERVTECAQALLDFAERQCEFEGCSPAIEADIFSARAALRAASEKQP